MSTEAALLAAVLAHPDEDTPRLAYADWLDEHADLLAPRDPKEVRARAEFVRLQIALDGRDGDPEFADARGRISELLARYRALWNPPPIDRGPFWPKREVRFYFRRGFPEFPIVNPAEFRNLVPELFAVAPVRQLNFSLDAEDATALAACPHLQPVRALQLHARPGLTGASVRQLLDSPHLSGLRELRFGWLDSFIDSAIDALTSSGPAGLEVLQLAQHQLTGPTAALLARAKTLRLRWLIAPMGACGDDGARQLAGSPALGRLEVLNLLACGLTPDGVRALAESPHLGSVWNLNLGWNAIGLDGGRALANSPRLANLRVLSLGNPELGTDGLKALSRSEHLGELRALELHYNSFRAGAAKVLADGPAFARLRALDLRRNAIGDGGARHLARARWDGLRCLCLAECSLKEEGARALAAGTAFPGLTHLDLGRNRIGTVGATALAAANRFPNLCVLTLNNNGIADAGAIALAASPQMETIEELNLESNRIGEAGAKALIESPHLGRLKRLGFYRNKLPRSLKAAFAKRFEVIEANE